jgi:hypothetical protein
MSKKTLFKNCFSAFFVSFSILSINIETLVAREFRGDFTLSCQNIKYSPAFFGSTLEACCAPNCQNTSIDLGEYLTNDRGTLKWVDRSGDYDMTCSLPRDREALDSNGRRTILTLSCKTGIGDERRDTSIDLDERIANSDGKLVYISPSNNPRPSPSFHREF